MKQLAQKLLQLPEAVYHKWQIRMMWIGPATLIPAMRYFQDPKETRDQLFVRDFSTYSLGAGLFYGAASLTEKVMDKAKLVKHLPARGFVGFLAGFTAYNAFSGMGALKLAKELCTPSSLKETKTEATDSFNQHPALLPVNRSEMPLGTQPVLHGRTATTPYNGFVPNHATQIPPQRRFHSGLAAFYTQWRYPYTDHQAPPMLGNPTTPFSALPFPVDPSRHHPVRPASRPPVTPVLFRSPTL
jgi:hypothetical protein